MFFILLYSSWISWLGRELTSNKNTGKDLFSCSYRVLKFSLIFLLKTWGAWTFWKSWTDNGKVGVFILLFLSLVISSAEEKKIQMLAMFVNSFIAELQGSRGPPSRAPYTCRKEKKTHELIFSWLLCLAVLFVCAYARRYGVVQDGSHTPANRLTSIAWPYRGPVSRDHIAG